MFSKNVRTRFARLVAAFPLVVSLGLLAGPVRAQGEMTAIGGTTAAKTAAQLPPGGESLLGPNPLAVFKLEGSKADQAEQQEVAVEGQPFARALRVTTKTKTGENDIVLAAPTIAGFKEVDTLFVRVYLRTTKTDAPDGWGMVKVNVEPDGKLERRARALYPGTVRAKAGAGWVRFDSPAMAMRGYGPNNARFAIRLGGTPQEVEIGGIEVLNYARRRFPHQLPHRSGGTYAGREKDAPWRQAARARIEKHRKGDLVIRVTDAGGKPIRGAQINVAMTRHQYPFGACVNESFFADSENTPDGQKYRDAIKKYFNHAVLEGGHKMRGWASANQRAKTVKTVSGLRDLGLTVRGHTLVWPGWGNLPDSLKKQYDDTKAAQGEEAAKAFLRTRVRDHVTEIVGAFKGQLTDWDVINETKTNHALMDILGEDIMVEWFQVARAVEPTIPLYLNDFKLLTGEHLPNFERHVKLLLDKGAPLTGLGEQGHGSALPIEQILANLDRLAKFNLPIKITEFDTVTPDEQLQADYTRDFLTAAFSHPSTAGFIMWGFWDGRHWLGDAPMFYPDWSLKPSGQAWIDLVHKEWWTRASGTADARGHYQTRGFLGDYDITVTHNGKTQTIKTQLPKNGKTLTVVLG